MRVLVVGSGGREHALVWKIARSPLVGKIYAAPGNPGIAQLAECVDIMPTHIDGLVRFAKQQRVNLTVVGPEAPLVAGITDAFTAEGLRIFGPSRDAARLEGSKAFCKALLRREGIPTAPFRTFTHAQAALEFLATSAYPVVVKADGLAAGKGTFVCLDREEAERVVRKIMVERVFGAAGETIVVEEFLRGVEASVMALTDGRTIHVLEHTQDHKRLLDGDRGPNTGGMGAYSPAPVASPEDYDRVISEILVPTVHAMNAAGTPFRGLLYAGVMFTRAGPRVLEFNVRFGDPETQPLMMRLRSDLVEAILACLEGRLDEVRLDWDRRAAVCVVMASQGYPGTYEQGYEITGIEDAEALGDVVVFHAGTARSDGRLVTAGGRVLGVTALGADIEQARARAYQAVARIRFHGAHYRSDIAAPERRRP
jgi:phosphoribosylamine--glycine ligase